jgi:hypothetical protein
VPASLFQGIVHLEEPVVGMDPDRRKNTLHKNLCIKRVVNLF